MSSRDIRISLSVLVRNVFSLDPSITPSFCTLNSGSPIFIASFSASSRTQSPLSQASFSRTYVNQSLSAASASLFFPRLFFFRLLFSLVKNHIPNYSSSEICKTLTKKFEDNQHFTLSHKRKDH